VRAPPGELLATHRHLVANRLRRVRRLTGLDPQRGYDRELLGLALRTHLSIVSSVEGADGFLDLDRDDRDVPDLDGRSGFVA
jgi:hypothetical protein